MPLGRKVPDLLLLGRMPARKLALSDVSVSIDAYRREQDDIPNRSEAVRCLVKQSLADRPKRVK
jgi:hypothetical protein